MPPNVFARKIGKDKSMIHKYIYGSVIPKHDIIIKIFRATFGAVTANDFHGLYSEDWEKEVSSKRAGTASKSSASKGPWQNNNNL